MDRDVGSANTDATGEGDAVPPPAAADRLRRVVVARKELRPAQVKLARELLTKLGFSESDPKRDFVMTPRMLRQGERFRRCYPDFRDKHGRWPPRLLKHIRISEDAYFGIIGLLFDITAKRTKPRQSKEEWERAQDLKLQTVEACL